MKSKALFYHAGCPVCVEAESMVADAINLAQYDVEVINFTDTPNRLSEAESLGIRSVPALVLNDQVFHINFGASLDELKANL